MSSAFVSILGFDSWLKHENDDLFKKMILPDGIDREVLINNILIEGAEFEVLYANPYYMQNAIEVWSRKFYKTFERWVNVLNLEYNPIDNYDRLEEWSDSGSANASSNDHTGTTIEDKKSAFDSSTYENNSLSNNASDSNSSTESSNTSIHTGRVHGNIGVMSTQNLIQQDLELYKNFNIYNEITELFIREFCLLVY